MNYKKSYSFLIQPQTVDFNLRITISSLTDLLMNAAGLHADEFGFGTRKLGDDGNAWVLLRSVIEMTEFPLQFETVHIETWIEDIGRVNTHRNFCIRNDSGKIIGYAVFNWAMIDYQTRKMKDLQSLQNMLHVATGESVPLNKPVRLDGVDGEPVDVFSVKYSHIDFNQHVNTMRYVEWVSNLFSLEHYKRFSITRFEMNFISEMLFGDEVTVYASNADELNYQAEIRNNGKPACRARIVFA